MKYFFFGNYGPGDLDQWIRTGRKIWKIDDWHVSNCQKQPSHKAELMKKPQKAKTIEFVRE